MRRGGSEGERKTYAHETLEGAGLSARLPPFEALKPIIAPKMEEVEGEELERGVRREC